MNLFAPNTKLLRTFTGLNQAEMAVSIGFSRTAWGNYETGLSVPSLPDTLKISNHFGISLTELVETDLSNDVRLTEKLEKAGIEVKSPPKSTGNSPANYNLSVEKSQLNDPKAPYLLSEDVVNQRLKEKDEIIEALKGQIEALKLALSQTGQTL